MKLFNIFKRKIIASGGQKIVASYGHETLEEDKVTAFGESCETKIPLIDGKTDYCHRCLEKMAIKCAWCKGVIFIGDPITLYTPSDKDFKIPEHAVVHNNNPLQLVGCLRWECAATGAGRAGFWYPPGQVFRVPTPVEMVFEQVQKGEDGMVIVSDLSDPKEAMKSL